jgi:hypothetical protein
MHPSCDLKSSIEGNTGFTPPCAILNPLQKPIFDIFQALFYSAVCIRIGMDLHHFGNLDPHSDPHQSDKLELDPDPHQFADDKPKRGI